MAQKNSDFVSNFIEVWQETDKPENEQKQRKTDLQLRTSPSRMMLRQMFIYKEGGILNSTFRKHQNLQYKLLAFILRCANPVLLQQMGRVIAVNSTTCVS